MVAAALDHWEYQSRGVWVAYPVSWAKQLQEAYELGLAEDVITHKQQLHRIDFRTMTQTNETTGKQRRIRVRAACSLDRPHSPPKSVASDAQPAPKQGPPAHLWQWLGEDSVWCTFDDAALGAIRSAWARRQRTVVFRKVGTLLPGVAPAEEEAVYELDFKQMRQQNMETGSRRPVRTIHPDALRNPPTHRWYWEAGDGTPQSFPNAISDWLCMLYDLRKGRGKYQFAMAYFQGDVEIHFSPMLLTTASGHVYAVRREPVPPADSLPPRVPVVWQVNSSSGFQDLPAAESAVLETAYQSQVDTLELGDGKYRVDFRQMVRTNLEHNGQRSLRRVRAAEAEDKPTPCCTHCPPPMQNQEESSWPDGTSRDRADLSTFDSVLRKHGAQPFSDAQFPPTDASFFGAATQAPAMRTHRWQRLVDIPASGPGAWTFCQGDFQPGDIVQGHLGSCWFVSALAVVAERPWLMQQLLPRPALQRSGAYVVCFFVHGRLTPIIVDDYFPVLLPQNGSGLWGTRGRGNQLWVPLMEKAYAKLHGSYAALTGGVPADSLSDLTGAPCKTIDVPWDRRKLPKGLWGKLYQWYRAGHIFAASCGRESNEVSSKVFEKVGLVEGHAYSVLRFEEVTAAGKAHHLVLLRNPYGRQEWMGDWSDSSPMWTPDLRSKLGVTQQDDGFFWMPYHDFLTYFFQVFVCFVGREPASSHTTLHVHPRASGTPHSVVMVEFQVPNTSAAPVVTSVELRQTGKRGKGALYQLNDLSGLVLRCDGPGDASLVGMALLEARNAVPLVTTVPLPPGNYRVIVCSLLGALSSIGPHPQSVAIRITAASTLLVRPSPVCEASFRVGMHLLLDRCKELEWRPFKVRDVQEPYPGVTVLEFRSYCGRCLAVINTSSSVVTAKYNATGTRKAQFSRGKCSTTDVIPPGTRQLLLFAGTAKDAVWMASQQYALSRGAPEAHDPPVSRTVHEPMPL
eukprot:EG_transcript_1278